MAGGTAGPSAWRAKVTSVKSDEVIPTTKAEKKERKYMYMIDLGFHGYEWSIELSFKALYELNQTVAQEIPGYCAQRNVCVFSLCLSCTGTDLPPTSPPT
eukprot:m.188671 g.188671  ORF g.188671 m.188671 type:complete len:100 (-) comp24832_c0_seq2:25-324(-)